MIDEPGTGMRFDVVAAPVRYPRAPLLALVVLTVVPGIALASLAVWSDRQADMHESRQVHAELAAPVDPDALAPVVGDGVPRGSSELVTESLSTGVFSYRRLPTSLSAAVGAARLADALGPLWDFLNDQSCAAVSVDGRLVSGANLDTPVIPASTQKLLIAGAALEVLGADHVFSTSVAAPPPIDGVVEGDLYLIGGGDPLLTSNDYPIEADTSPAFNTTSLDALVDAVAAAGITTIRGAIVGDGSRYDDQFVIDSWAADAVFVDAGPYDALMVNDSRVLGRSGRQSDPNEAAAREFARLLEARGIRVSNGWRSGVADPAVPVIGRVDSAPLAGVVEEMLLTSDNNTAEMLLKEIGFADTGEGTLGSGLTVLDRTLRSWGVPMEGVRFVDGSGLSAANRTTCAAMLTVLARLADGPVPAGLPVAGRSGTLADEFVDSPMAGRMIAKTGTLGNPPVEEDPPAVKALAGYVPEETGNRIAFVMIQMSPDVVFEGRYEPLWLALGDRLATYTSRADAVFLGPR
jgi:serine-type D-Ala-D-Ala carboxypeptidase/endopeptidase (penicillin-binding protein 4)